MIDSNEVTINGERITYRDGETRFLVEIGRGKGSYNLRFSTFSPMMAVKYYDAINIGNGYKKRLRRDDTSKTILRQLS